MLADVDADLQRRLHRIAELPVLSIGAGLSQHPTWQGADHSRLLGQAEEVARRQQPAARMIPPPQGLEADDRAIAQPNRRLVVEHELTPLQRVTQLGLQLHPIADRGLLLRLGSLVPALPAPPPGIERK